MCSSLLENRIVTMPCDLRFWQTAAHFFWKLYFAIFSLKEFEFCNIPFFLISNKSKLNKRIKYKNNNQADRCNIFYHHLENLSSWECFAIFCNLIF